MTERVLITGGAGFIGSHLADNLLRRGVRVRVLDNLDPQVHGDGRRRPRYLARDVELLVGDVRDAARVAEALQGCDAVVHLAAKVGVGQSMYRIEEYTSVNAAGTAVLLEALSRRPVGRLVVASSMSVYGEGLYRRGDGQVVEGRRRTLEQLRRGFWELSDQDGAPLVPEATPETKAPCLESVYALGKYDQERMSLLVGQAYGIPTVALRFFNVYGPRQALSNPYTGVLAIFAARLLNGNAPLVFEDGEQRRDFVSVHDVAEACAQALTSSSVDFDVLNIGSGEAHSVREVAERVAKACGRRIAPEVTRQYRVGDIRHCFADVSRARERIGYTPRVSFDQGLAELATWLEGQTAKDSVVEARAELQARGLAL